MSIAGRPDPSVARLHPNRRVGAGYAAFTVAVGLGALVGVGWNLAAGSFVLALVATVVGGCLVWFLSVVSLGFLTPRLDADDVGIRGRISGSTAVDSGWDDITIDLNENASRATFRLDIGGASVEVALRSWDGFADFVLLVASNTAAARRLTPAARDEVRRLLRLDDDGSAGPGI